MKLGLKILILKELRVEEFNVKEELFRKKYAIEEAVRIIKDLD